MSEFGTPGWVKENEERSKYMEKLYQLDGRDNASHPLWGTYTGLYQGRLEKLMLEDRKNFLGNS
jgi:hypothetical protein